MRHGCLFFLTLQLHTSWGCCADQPPHRSRLQPADDVVPLPAVVNRDTQGVHAASPPAPYVPTGQASQRPLAYAKPAEQPITARDAGFSQKGAQRAGMRARRRAPAVVGLWRARPHMHAPMLRRRRAVAAGWHAHGEGAIQTGSCARARRPAPAAAPTRPAWSTNRICGSKKVRSLPGTHWFIHRMQAASPEQASADLEAAAAVVLPVGQSVHERLCPPVDQLPLGQAALRTQGGGGARARGVRVGMHAVSRWRVRAPCRHPGGADA